MAFVDDLMMHSILAVTWNLAPDVLLMLAAAHAEYSALRKTVVDSAALLKTARYNETA